MKTKKKKAKELKESVHLHDVEFWKKRDKKIKLKAKKARALQLNRRESQRISAMNKLDALEDAGNVILVGLRAKIINESVSLGGKRQ